MHAKLKTYGATAVKFPSSSKLTSALCSKRQHKKIREGVRHIADSTGPLEARFSLSVFQLLVTAATYLHFVPVQLFSCKSSAREGRSILHRAALFGQWNAQHIPPGSLATAASSRLPA
jgi:hypothetical protein